MRPFALTLALAAVAAALDPISIDSYGAIPWTNTYAAGVANGRALSAAMQAANEGVNRAVLVPPMTNYTIVPAGPLVGMIDVTLIIDGNLIAWLPPNGNSSYWPVDSRGVALDVIAFWQSQGVNITTHYGTYDPTRQWGIIDGQGYDWWNYVLFSTRDNRPNLIGMASVLGPIYMTGLRLINSPEYHAFLHDIRGAIIRDIEVYVNVEQQQALLGSYGYLTMGEGLAEVQRLRRELSQTPHASPRRSRLEALLETYEGSEGDGMRLLPAGIPTFPLNTDGIDPAGSNVTIVNCTITNFDDAIAVKPLASNARQVSGNCSQNMFFSQIAITFGVGATIGSVPPNPSVNCIRNVTFEDITFDTAIKGIYIKPNPPVGNPLPAGSYADSWARKSDFYSFPGGMPELEGVQSLQREVDEAEEQEEDLFGNDDPSSDDAPIPIPPHSDSIGSGVIDRITYRNVYGHSTLWWSIYVGLQQQQQPGNQSNTGCSFFYPLFNSSCPLQPRVPVTNLVLKNVTFLDSILSPGLLRCANATEGANYPGFRPCSGWVFEDVIMTSVLNFPVSQEEGGYLCHGLDGPVFNGTSNPIPKCT